MRHVKKARIIKWNILSYSRTRTHYISLTRLAVLPTLPCNRCEYRHCYNAVCNNYAICNTLQTALNCNAVCNTSYFKLRCEGNVICNVLQIASKFYHLNYWIGEKIDQQQNAALLSYLYINSARNQPIRARHAKLLINAIFGQNTTQFCPRTFTKFGGGALKPIRPAVY